ncbi:MAG: TIGR03960 family B12-binding radical SAM protein, partial [Candidatus Zixiibacteriota bacterium]
MQELLEKRFFPFVVKPGRYAGGELGQITKEPAGRVNYLHCYPDKYELGQSYPGLQILYNIVNQQDRFLCERAFAIDRDAEAIMRKENISLFSLESRRSAREFDAIGFTLVDETVYSNTLSMIDLAGIPLRWKDRSDGDPLILAGGPAAFNPEPLAPFIDLFFIGDAEEGLLQLLDAIGATRSLSRPERLVQIGRTVESVYIPSMYDGDMKPLHDGIPARVRARVVRELKPDTYPTQPLVPLIETVHNHLGIEIMRGCPQGCRFCMAGSIYRPVRLRPQNEILQQIETQLTNTGYDEISLLALSATDYPEIEPLTTTLVRRYEQQRVSIGLPSLRPGSVTPALFDAVKRIRKSGLTIAPEAGTERLRLFIRKDFPDEAIYDTARLAFERGWITIKLYFMIGLPTETDDDLLGIGNICRRIVQIGKEYPGNKMVNVTLSPFIPKAHTPFQWDELVTEAEIERRIGFIKRTTRANQVNFKINQPRLAILSALLGRGGRQIGDVIEAAYKLGCRFEGWSEDFDFNGWMEAFRSLNVDTEQLLRPISFSSPLPWGHIDKGVSTD